MVSRMETWNERTRGDAFTGWSVPTESLPPGHNLLWKMWKTLDRPGTQAGRTIENLNRRGTTQAV